MWAHGQFTSAEPQDLLIFRHIQPAIGKPTTLGTVRFSIGVRLMEPTNLAPIRRLPHSPLRADWNEQRGSI